MGILATLQPIVEVALLVVITLLQAGRWTQAREDAEKKTPVPIPPDAPYATRADLAAYEVAHAKDHAAIWVEIERNRNHWHKDLVPWQQEVTGRLATLTEHQLSTDRELKQLWAIYNRRRDRGETE